VLLKPRWTCGESFPIPTSAPLCGPSSMDRRSSVVAKGLERPWWACTAPARLSAEVFTQSTDRVLFTTFTHKIWGERLPLASGSGTLVLQHPDESERPASRDPVGAQRALSLYSNVRLLGWWKSRPGNFWRVVSGGWSARTVPPRVSWPCARPSCGFPRTSHAKGGPRRRTDALVKRATAWEVVGGSIDP
jgi:hypothetical protein